MALTNFSSMKFTTKLFAAVALLCITSILIISATAIRMSQNGLNSLGRNALEQIHKAVYDSLLTYDQTISRKLDSDLKIFEKEVLAKGALVLDPANATQSTVVNQVTQQSEQIALPRFMAGERSITGANDIVDSVSASTGSTATIFQLVGDKLLRVSTTVKKQNGERHLYSF